MVVNQPVPSCDAGQGNLGGKPGVILLFCDPLASRPTSGEPNPSKCKAQIPTILISFIISGFCLPREHRFCNRVFPSYCPAWLEMEAAVVKNI